MVWASDNARGKRKIGGEAITYRIIVCGSRSFNDYGLLERELSRFIAASGRSDEVRIVCGKAKGADTLGEKFAMEHELPIDCYPAQWDKHGPGAGYVRNLKMIRNADAVVAFWDGESRGTRHCIDNARKKGLDVTAIRVG